jgi:hypothetical protein
MAKVQRKKVGQSLPLTKEDRVGVNEKKERRGSAMQEAKGYKKPKDTRSSFMNVAAKDGPCNEKRILEQTLYRKLLPLPI